MALTLVILALCSQSQVDTSAAAVSDAVPQAEQRTSQKVAGFLTTGELFAVGRFYKPENITRCRTKFRFVFVT